MGATIQLAIPTVFLNVIKNTLVEVIMLIQFIKYKRQSKLKSQKQRLRNRYSL